MFGLLLDNLKFTFQWIARSTQDPFFPSDARYSRVHNDNDTGRVQDEDRGSWVSHRINIVDTSDTQPHFSTILQRQKKHIVYVGCWHISVFIVVWRDNFISYPLRRRQIVVMTKMTGLTSRSILLIFVCQSSTRWSRNPYKSIPIDL